VAERFSVASSIGQPGRVDRDGNDLADRLRSAIGKRKLPELVIGLALVACGLLGVMWLGGTTASGTEVVVASNNIEQGHILGKSDLATLRVPDEIASMFYSVTEAEALIGVRAPTAIESGKPMLRMSTLVGEPLGMGEMLTAVPVRVGAYPPELSPGATVLVVVVPDPTTTNGATPYVFGKSVGVWAMESSIDDPSLTIATLRGDRDLFLATSGALEIRLALVGPATQGERE
jgi:hypothetical protein